MELPELVGYYDYRNLVYDTATTTNDLNVIRFVEAELFLTAQDGSAISGTLSFPTEPESQDRLFIDITGNIKNMAPMSVLEFTGLGRRNTMISSLWCESACSVSYVMEGGIVPRLALTGTILLSKDRDDLENQEIKKAAARASLIAIKRNFTEPRDIDGVSIIPSALSMIASKSHRLKHAVWHTLRLRGIWYELDEESKSEIRNLGWGLDRPPFNENEELDLSNGAGEDFLFMHRKMITMMVSEYNSQGVPYIKSWESLPTPDTPQLYYSEADDPKNPGKKIFRLDSLNSGNIVPPAYLVPSQNKARDLTSFRRLKFLKRSDYFENNMVRLENILKNPMFLASLTLGSLGNLIEFEIHNQMHMRWSSTPRDPKSGEPSNRSPFDFDTKWDDPKYDYLGDFYSSHVNPLFWRLHGWADDRIEDWFNAHETIHPGEIQRHDCLGVSWFKLGKWVKVSKPFYWPESHHHNHHHDHHLNNHHGNNHEDGVENMLRVMEIVRIFLSRQASGARAELASKVGTNLNSFMHDIEPQ
jgi:hypothetical protein